ncbi:winged helix-turn-helix transcriptional regulator [Candidatus Bathyarchaeota archaeon]|nr:winged helix-turn-helix transcriptional regulator [Candidatus Bathyarchaeota archaeon]
MMFSRGFEEDTYSKIFAALKHPVRRKILRILNESPCTYTRLLNSLGIETGFLNYHLENLNELVTKDESGKYILSAFGNAALTLVAGVEYPSKRKPRRVFGKVNSYLVVFLVISLILSNAFLFYVYQEEYKAKTNAFGEVLILNRGFLSNSINVINSSITDSRFSQDELIILYDHMIQLSRQYKVIESLDYAHKVQWSQIEDAFDAFMEFSEDLLQKIMRLKSEKNQSSIYLNYAQCQYLEKIKSELRDIGAYSMPPQITLGSNPSVPIDENDMTNAVNISIKLQEKIISLRSLLDL